MLVSDAKAVNFKSKFLCYPQGIACGQSVVWHVIRDNQDILALLFEGQHGLHHPPQVPSQRCPAISSNIEQLWHRLPVPHDGEYRVRAMVAGKVVTAGSLHGYGSAR